MYGNKIDLSGFETSLIIGIVSCLISYSISWYIMSAKDTDNWISGFAYSKYLCSKFTNLCIFNTIFTIWIFSQIIIYIEGPALDSDCEKAKEQIYYIVLYYISFICSAVVAFFQFYWPVCFYIFMSYNVCLIIFLVIFIFSIPSILGGILLFIWNYQYIGSIFCFPLLFYYIYMFIVTTDLIRETKNTLT